MKYAPLLTAALLVSIATPTIAGDGNVPRSTLRKLGLARMHVLSDQEGMHVRGLSGNAFSSGQSVVFGRVSDPFTLSFVMGGGATSVQATAENAGEALTQAQHLQGTGVLNLNLTVTTSSSTFSGFLFGGAGGSALASVH